MRCPPSALTPGAPVDVNRDAGKAPTAAFRLRHGCSAMTCSVGWCRLHVEKTRRTTPLSPSPHDAGMPIMHIMLSEVFVGPGEPLPRVVGAYQFAGGVLALTWIGGAT